MTRLRLAAIDFLNPAPLMWDFDHEPGKSVLRERYDVETMMPSQCAARLTEGTADLGLVPVSAYATTPDLLIVPSCTIASKGPIRSLILVIRASVGLDGIRIVAADTSSRASLAYLQIMFRKFWKVDAKFFQHAPVLDSMLREATAALLIGDPALLALEDQDCREARTGERLLYLDLGREWRTLTGLPWISAVWAVRVAAISGDAALRRQLVEDLLGSRDHGLAHREELVSEWSHRIAVPATTIRTYLNENIYYVLDDECLEGLRRFYALAAECGVLPPAPPLRLLEP